MTLRTPFCDKLGVQLPILVAPFGPWDEVELAVAAASAGCLASLGTAVRSVDELRQQWTAVRERTDRPFVINHTGRPFSAEAFAATLDFKPAAISFHMGIPRELIDQAHDRGILWLQTVADGEGAAVALEAGADVLIAQGTESGGNSGWIGTLVLVPLVVDLAGAVPVVAAGGIADGRGIAAALTLGAQAASLGTRFLATEEMAIDAAWKERIRNASALDAVKFPHSERVMPPFTLPQLGQPAAPRALRTPLIDQLESDAAAVDPSVVGPRFVQAAMTGGGHDMLPFAGQSAGLVNDILPVAALVNRLVEQTRAALDAANAAVDRR